MFIGVDVGRRSVKVSGPLGPVRVFPSRVGEARQLRLADGGAYGDYVVELDGRAYFVGHLAEESFARREMATESKLHEETRVLFASALGLAEPEPGSTVVTGLPISQHTNLVKEDLQNLLAGIKGVALNGRWIPLAIRELLVVPEGAGAFWAEAMDENGMIRRQDLIRHDDSPVRIRVLDLGSRTVNLVTLIGGRYLDRESFTLPYGLLELDAMGAGMERDFVRRVVGDLSTRLSSLHPMDQFLLAGGGALVLTELIREHLPMTEVIPEPVTANARGMQKLGIARARVQTQ